MSVCNADRITSGWNGAFPQGYMEECWTGTCGYVQVSSSALSAATAQWGGHHPAYLYGYKGNKCLSIILFDSWK